MTVDVLDADGVKRTLSTLGDLSKGGGAVDAATLRLVTASDDPVLTALALLATAAKQDTLAAAVATAAKQDTLAGLVSTAAKQDTLAALVATAAKQDTLAGLVSTAAKQDALAALVGEVQASPTANTLLDRVKALLTGIVLAASANEIGRTNIKHVMASGSALTRPANQTPYGPNDSISNDGTAGNVTANVVTISDANDDPVNITQVLLQSTDTAPGTAGVFIRLHLFNSDPTANSGVVGGDNIAWSNKQAGWVGSFTGQMVAFSDGSRGILVPDGPPVLTTTPGTGARTFWWQLQTLGAFTPSANSTTFTPKFRGYQGRA